MDRWPGPLRLAVLLPLLLLNPHALIRWRGGRQGRWRRPWRHLRRPQRAGQEHRPELICLPLPWPSGWALEADLPRLPKIGGLTFQPPQFSNGWAN